MRYLRTFLDSFMWAWGNMLNLFPLSFSQLLVRPISYLPPDAISRRDEHNRVTNKDDREQAKKGTEK